MLSVPDAGFGIYIHIPFCIQKCHYCDFTTLDRKAMAMQQYTDGLITEMRQRAAAMPRVPVGSIYFGGGTPSLLPASDILAVLNEIANLGFVRSPNCEVTIEINPGTVDPAKLDLYLAAGVNRFSVGVQSFRDDYLTACGREHSGDDSRRTLRLLAERDLNYSFDLLFGLPNQSLHDLRRDLEELSEFAPPHVSLYNLTIPHEHKMSVGRASDDIQAEMFELIEPSLLQDGILRYEISNFARPGFESRHNRLYWTGGAYWGVGISAHSYFPAAGDHGVRCWNSPHLKTWIAQCESVHDPGGFWRALPAKQVEFLAANEALTDFFHTRLRQLVGFSKQDLRLRLEPFNIGPSQLAALESDIESRLERLIARGLIVSSDDRFFMSRSALPVANTVFLELTFSQEELARGKNEI